MATKCGAEVAENRGFGQDAKNGCDRRQIDIACGEYRIAVVKGMVQPEDIYEPEWVEWFRMSPDQRWAESSKLWEFYLEAGGSLDPEPDPQSPFFFSEDFRASPANGRAGVRVLRSCGV